MNETIIGVSSALGAALTWAIGSILFRRIGDEASPLGMTLTKGAIGLVALGVACLIMGVQPMTLQSFVLLGLSGIVGISVADTLFFIALMRMDPRLTLLLFGTVGNVFTVIMAMIFLGERPTLLAWIGIPLVLAGVTWVMAERMPDEEKEKRALRFSGIAPGLLASVCMSGSYIVAKSAMEDVSALQSTVVRYALGTMGLGLWGLATGRMGRWLSPFKNAALLRSIIFAAVFIAFGGFWLSMAAYKYTDASIATILMATEPLFIIPLAAIILKDRISARAIVGAAVAVVGVALIILSVSGS